MYPNYDIRFFFPTRLSQRSPTMKQPISFAFVAFLLSACCSLVNAQLSSLPFGKLDRNFGDNGIVTFGTGATFFGDSTVTLDGKILFANTVQRPVGYEIQVIRLLANGDFDPSFGTGGIAFFSFGTNTQSASVIALSDGKILVGGHVGNQDFPPAFDALIFRIHENGQIDSSFGTSGKVIKDFIPSGEPGVSNDGGTTLAITEEKKIIAALKSHRYISSSDRATTFSTLIRMESNGAIDQSFGSSGVAQSIIGNDYAGSTIFFSDIHALIQDDDKILLGQTVDRLDSNAPPGQESRSIVSRFLPSGQIDGKFGNNGHSIPFNGVSGTSSLNITSDGRYFVGIRNSLIRLAPNGAIDQSFGIGGRVYFGSNVDAGYAMIDVNDKVIIAGSETINSPTGGRSVGRIFRLHSNGSADLRFGNLGSTRIDIGNQNQRFGQIFRIDQIQAIVIGNCNAPEVQPCLALIRVAR